MGDKQPNPGELLRDTLAMLILKTLQRVPLHSPDPIPHARRERDTAGHLLTEPLISAELFGRTPP